MARRDDDFLQKNLIPDRAGRESDLLSIRRPGGLADVRAGIDRPGLAGREFQCHYLAYSGLIRPGALLLGDMLGKDKPSVIREATAAQTPDFALRNRPAAEKKTGVLLPA